MYGQLEYKRAVMGVWPFGSARLFGTGPEAGGPHYMIRFATVRIPIVNTATLDGNGGLPDPD